MRLFVFALLMAAMARAEDIRRPRITGIAHVAFFVKDVDKARAFYKDFLGYSEPFLLNRPDGKLSLTFIKVNDRQYIELFPEEMPGTDRLHHISIETDDAEGMRRYLAFKGIRTPDRVSQGRIGNANFNVQDPDGHTVEIVQYLPTGWSLRDKGKALPETRISSRILHAGIVVNALEPAMEFYREVLGFQEIWRGSADGKVLSWVNMRVPEGADYVEFMLHDPLPEPARRGGAHHICLEVPDLAKSAAILEKRAGAAGYARSLATRTGTNRKRQLNLFDPDGTRTELMEAGTVDGVAAASSTAPPPK